MEKFLYSVAKFILENYADALKTCCVVFPNQRSEVYFCEAVKKINSANPKVIWLPHNCTIDEFVHSVCNLKVAPQITLLTTLYQVHQELTHSGETFDRFFPWAQTILADFDDIDKYLADAHSLLQNIQDIKELDSTIDYLTDEQRKAIEQFFNKTIGDGDSELKKRFLDIWHILLPLYESFQKRLNVNGLTYEGQVYRQASEIVGSADYELPYSTVFFVGFNAITRSEEKIFELLQNQGKALFFWDYDNAYINNPLHEAGLFMRRFVKKFKSPEGFVCCHDFDVKQKAITIIPSPTVSGQMSVASKYLATVPESEISDTALVLSDENLLMNVLEHTVPYIDELNVTMGYKIKNSVAGQWIELLIQLQSNKRVTEKGTTFYYKNVVSVLQHPFFICASRDFSAHLSKRIKDEVMFQVPMENFADDAFAKMVFASVCDQHSFSLYMLDILKYLMSIWSGESENAENPWLLQQELVYRLILQIQQLESELSEEKLDIELVTYFQLLRKCVNSLKVPFEGEPVKGLQVMGFLETRNLDFRNLIILNVNEGTLPVDGSTPSFVPHSLRRAFRLPTHEERESMYAYYFYRLIQRAQNVILTYFVGKTECKKGEPSRYIMQMIYGDCNAKVKIMPSNISFSSEKPIEMKKSGHTMDLLNIYVADGKKNDDVKSLSPSSLVTYQKCPLQFYFGKVLRLEPDDEIEENIDARQFGNIFHEAMHLIYSGFVSNRLITGDDIRSISKDFISEKIDCAFVKYIMPLKYDRESKCIIDKNFKLESNLNGNNRIVYNVIRKYIDAQLEFDAKTADVEPIKFIGLEKPFHTLFPVAIGDKTINVKLGGIIDRVDDIGSEIRIIDYKTGSNETVPSKIEDIFDPQKINDYKGVLQTLVYCMVYADKHPESDVITPYLFKSTELSSANPAFKVHTKKSKSSDAFVEGNYLKISGNVRNFVSSTLSDIFDESKSFLQTTDKNNCKHCNFFYFCAKQSTSEM